VPSSASSIMLGDSSPKISGYQWLGPGRSVTLGCADPCSAVLQRSREVVVAFVAFRSHIAAMSISPRSSPGKKTPRSSGAVSASERNAAALVATLLSPGSTEDRGLVQVVDAGGRRVDLPTRLTEVIYRAAELLAEGRAVAVLPDEEMLSTQSAAEFLNISRQYLVRLVDAGELAAVKVGSHRRLRATDVAEYKATRDGKRASALDRLTALSEDAGGYTVGASPR